jgi:hypothetical protein
LTVNVTKAQLVELSKQAQELQDLDWGMIPISEDAVFSKLADAVITGYANLDGEYRDVILLTAILTLTVQSFVMNQQRLELLNTIAVLQESKK